MDILTSAWRFIIFLYSLLLFAISGFTIVAAIGRPEPLDYITLALATPINRIFLGLAAILFLVLAVLSLLYSFKTTDKKVRLPNSITVEKNLVGEVSVTVQALKVIIMKAIKKVDGVKEVKSAVTPGTQGLIVNLHIMIDPELSVPETSKDIQNIVKQYIEEIGGLPVGEIKILVDDFGTNHSPTN